MENKPRLQATHFIEVYRTKSTLSTHLTPILHIEDLEMQLNHTESLQNLKTILVAKIKFKPCKK
jgi:hypothetical protein